jgi:transposase
MMDPNDKRDALLLQALASPKSDHLRVLVTPLIEEVKVLRQEVEQLKQTNHVLRLKVDAMAKKLFGKSSERLDPAQLQMVFAALEDEATATPPKPEASASAESVSEAESTAPSEPSKNKRRSFEDRVANLPVEQVIIEPDEVKAQPEAWHCIGEEVTKLIDYQPGKFISQHLIRRKYVRKEERHLPPVIAPLHTLQDRCTASPRLLAHIITQRFEMHLPYYRIEQQCDRLGLAIPRQTMSGWVGMAHDACGLIMQRTKADVFADGYVQIDETPVKYQDDTKEGSCGTGYLWVVHNPLRQISYMVWSTSRGAKALDEILPPDFTGIIQCDGYAAYESLSQSEERQGSIILAGCMAHMRRKFFAAKAEGEDAQWMLTQLQKLYRIESQLRQSRASPSDIRAERWRNSAPILTQIKARLDSLTHSRKHLPKSLTGEALNQWDKLQVYLRDGRV